MRNILLTGMLLICTGVVILFVVYALQVGKSEGVAVGSSEVLQATSSELKVEKKINAEIIGIQADKKSVEQSVVNVFNPRRQVEDRYAHLVEPCDFKEMRAYVATILDKPELQEIQAELPIVVYEEKIDKPIDFILNSKWLYACALIVRFQSEESEEISFGARGLLVNQILLGVNESLEEVSYIDGATLGSFSLGASAADGQLSTSMGTIVSDSNTLRPVFATAGTAITNQFDPTLEDLCPCRQFAEMKITNAFTEEDLARAYNGTSSVEYIHDR